MAKLFGFTAKQTGRIKAVVEDFESPRTPASRNEKSGSSDPSPRFWAKLTDEDSENEGFYAFKKQVPVNGEMIDATPLFEVSDFTAIEVNGVTGRGGDVVELQFAGYSLDDKAIYIFESGPVLPDIQYPRMILQGGPGNLTVADWFRGAPAVT